MLSSFLRYNHQKYPALPHTLRALSMSVLMPSDSPLNPPQPLSVSEAQPHPPAAAPAPPRRPPPTTRYSWRNIHPQATLHYIRDAEQADIQVELLQGPVGFDLEWKPNFRKGEPENPVSLVQLANNETILLLQISAMKGNAPTKYCKSLSPIYLFSVPD
jgi:hypothetical protein